MMLHSADYLELFSIVCVAREWLEMAAAAKEALAGAPGELTGYYEAKLCAAQYWFATELPRVEHLAHLCRSGEDSYQRLDPDWL
jgi:butyryl-CoA dehydrogenase